MLYEVLFPNLEVVVTVSQPPAGKKQGRPRLRAS